MSSLSFDQSKGSQPSKELSLSSATPLMLQLTDHKSLTQSAAQSTDAVSIQDYWADHQLKQGFQAPDVHWDAGALSSSSLEECRIPVKQQDKKKSNTECVLEKKEAAEAGLGNKMKHTPHSINPKVKDQGHKESILLSKDETVAKTMIKKVEKSPPSTKGPAKLAKLEKTTEDKSITFFDARQSLDNELQQHSFQSRRSWFQCLSHNSKHSPLLTCAPQPKIHARPQISPQQEALSYKRRKPIPEKKEFSVPQTSASP
nr:family with sequence similarity 205 member C [Molossus molossus]